jgi:hydrogenase/urease accessory protein HupE
MQRILPFFSAHLKVLLLIIGISSLWPHHASAHNNSYGYMDIRPESEAVRIDLTLNYMELGNAIDLPVNLEAAPTTAELEQALSGSQDALQDYLASGLTVYRDEIACAPQLIGTKVSTIEDSPMAHFQLLYPCDGQFTRIHYDLFVQDINRSHLNFANITGEQGEQEFTFSIAEQDLTIGEHSWLRQGWNFILLGMEHIFTGYDHILFVLCLLPAAASIGKLVEVVTAFTLGHSITLGLATLGVVSLPSRLVEAAIALSIIYVAVENLLKRKAKHRWFVVLLFGLIHGFGFAGILQEMELSRSTLASSLLFFNVGVELGQIIIIALVFPLVVLLRRYRTYPRIVYASSAFVIVMGLFWFMQRTAIL